MALRVNPGWRLTLRGGEPEPNRWRESEDIRAADGVSVGDCGEEGRSGSSVLAFSFARPAFWLSCRVVAAGL